MMLHKTKMLMIFITAPAFICFIFPAEKTIALEGVPTGSMNAWQQLKVTGIIRMYLTIWATMGSRMDAIAVFEAISVIAEVRKHMINRTANGGKVAKEER